MGPSATLAGKRCSRVISHDEQRCILTAEALSRKEGYEEKMFCDSLPLCAFAV